MRFLVGLLVAVLFFAPAFSLAEDKKDTTRDLKVIAAEPKDPELPNEDEIIREVIKTKVFEAEIEPIDDEDYEKIVEGVEISALNVSFLDELNAAFNTKDFEAIKSFINTTDFFIMDWNQEITSSQIGLENHWQELQGMPNFDNWRNSVKLNFIKSLSPTVSVISSEVKVSQADEDVFFGSVTIIVEFVDDAWKVKGIHISKMPEHIEHAQIMNLNVINYVMLFVGFLMGILIARAIYRKQ